jgi:hypothetical protein
MEGGREKNEGISRKCTLALYWERRGGVSLLER